MRERGWSWKETLLSIAILGGVVIILSVIAGRAGQADVERDDMSNMRAIYVALSQYEESNDQMPAPDLLHVRRDLGNDAYYLASNDPFANEKASSFPLEPTLPAWAQHSPVRISFSYLLNYQASGTLKLGPWSEVRTNPMLGEIACVWYGKISSGPNFTATTDGGILRVNTDGSIYRFERRNDLTRFTPNDLFVQR